MTEHEWQRIENTMSFIVEQQAKFEARMEAEAEASKGRMAEVDKRLAASNRRMDRLERFADRTIKAAERRMAKAEARLDRAEVERAELRAELKSFLQSMRRSQGNGKHKA
ncbi:MAG TPA: hypothetical protein VNM47_19915 [Terriglobia bacterium]|nr:hypothetical protein [Terriglobia bacterium]